MTVIYIHDIFNIGSGGKISFPNIKKTQAGAGGVF
jgi:hypothetical protein